MTNVSDDLKRNWGNYLKIGTILIALSAWGYTAQAKWETHSLEMRDSIKLLMLICKNSAPKLVDKLECYSVIERR